MKVLPYTLILSPLFCYSRKRLFEEIAECASAELGVDPQLQIDELNYRETEGSTVFFQGVALPHAVMKKIPYSLAVLSILDKPVTFNSIDSDPQFIDIAFTLFVSVKDEYNKVEKLLLDVTDILSNQDLLNSLRLCRNENAKLKLILEKIDLLLVESNKA